MPKPSANTMKRDGKKTKQPATMKRGGKKPKLPASMKRRGKKREVVFDPEARKSYLRGFSERKRERRAFGLAMQRVKDRTAKIEQRAQEKKDEMDRVEQAEQQKEQLRKEALENSGALVEDEEDFSDDENGSGSDDEGLRSESSEQAEEESAVLDRKTYDDKQTESHWGGHVTVTTSVVDMGDESDTEEPTPGIKNVDSAQKFAGKVEKYLAELKGKTPSKKKEQRSAKRKGRNGAADQKGMGGAANLKLAQKVLTKAKSKQGVVKKNQGKKSRR